MEIFFKIHAITLSSCLLRLQLIQSHPSYCVACVNQSSTCQLTLSDNQRLWQFWECQAVGRLGCTIMSIGLYQWGRSKPRSSWLTDLGCWKLSGHQADHSESQLGHLVSVGTWAFYLMNGSAPQLPKLQERLPVPTFRHLRATIEGWTFSHPFKK